jgi:hypothetical protein
MVIEFLTAEGPSPTDIPRRLRGLYGEDALNVSSIRCWVRRFKDGEQDIGDRPSSGRPASTATTETKVKFDALIRDDRRITSELCAAIGIGKLGYRKVCARWVPKMLTVKHKTFRKHFLAEPLKRNEKDRHAFLSRIITGDKTCFHYYDLLTKRQSMEWHHQSSPRKKKIQGADFCG